MSKHNLFHECVMSISLQSSILFQSCHGLLKYSSYPNVCHTLVPIRVCARAMYKFAFMHTQSITLAF